MSDEMETHQQGRGCISYAEVRRIVLAQFVCWECICAPAVRSSTTLMSRRQGQRELHSPQHPPSSEATVSNGVFILVGNVYISRPHVHHSVCSNNPI